MTSRLTALGLLALTAAPSYASEQSGLLEQRGFVSSVPESLLRSQLRDPRLVDPTRAERLEYQLRVQGRVEGRPTRALGLRFGLDSGLVSMSSAGLLIDGRDPGPQASRTLLLGHTWAEYEFWDEGALLLRAGKLRPSVADGAVFDAYAFGLVADLDLGLMRPDHPWLGRLEVLFPSGDLELATFESPLLQASVGYRFRRRARVRLSTAMYVDRGATGPVIASSLIRGQAALVTDAFARFESVIRAHPCPDDGATNRQNSVACLQDALLLGISNGTLGFSTRTQGLLGWTSLSADIGGDDWSVDALAVFGYGRIDLTLEPNLALDDALSENLRLLSNRREELSNIRQSLVRDRTLDLSSWLGQLTFRWSVFEDLTVDGFALALSGDRSVSPSDTSDGTYRAFVSLAPLMAHTSLFFGGGTVAALASPTATTLAPDGAGLLSGGLGATGYLGERVRLRAVAAAMSSLHPNSSGARFQGVELDFQADALLLEWLTVFLDTALMIPGPYFGAVPVAYQVFAGAQVNLHRSAP